jgi:hypothetical protein
MTARVPSQIENTIENVCLSEGRELVFGLAYAVGTDYKPVQDTVQRILNEYGYKVHTIRVSDLIASMTDHPLLYDNEIHRIGSLMKAGNLG